MTLGEHLRNALTQNVGLKLLSFTCALLLYSLVHGAQDAQRSVSVDLVVLLPPETARRVLVSPIPPSVRVTLRGSHAALDELHADDVGNVQLDVRAGQEKRVVLDKSLVHVPAGVRVEQVDPPSLDLVWDDLVTRDVPVQVTVAGTPALGYVVKGVPVAEPQSVRVKGPKTEVQLLQHARADAFDVSGLTEGSYKRSLAIDKPSGALSYDVGSVSVILDIQRELAERSFPKLAVAVVGAPKARTQPTDVDVRLLCPPDVVHALRAEQVVPRVEVKSVAASGSESLPVLVTVDKCEARVTPQAVIVRW
jgi:YbbR domain-containing protein